MNRAIPEPPFTLEFAAALLAECKRRGLILRIDEGVIRIADPSKADDAPYRYTMRQAAELLAGAPTKASARTPGQIEAARKPPQLAPRARAGRLDHFRDRRAARS